MKKIFSRFLFLITILISQNIFAQARLFYTAQKGDQLSLILDRLNIHPINGPNGYWKKTVAVNPALQSSRGMNIHPGDKIYLPEEVRPLIQHTADILDLGEVFPRDPADWTTPAVEIKTADSPLKIEPAIVVETPVQEVKKDLTKTQNVSVEETHSIQKIEKIFYVAKKGDYLSLILDRLDLHPINGPRGYWKKTIQLNPSLAPKTGHEISPGDRIELPIEVREQIASTAWISETGEVLFDKPKALAEKSEDVIPKPAPDLGPVLEEKTPTIVQAPVPEPSPEKVEVPVADEPVLKMNSESSESRYFGDLHFNDPPKISELAQGLGLAVDLTKKSELPVETEPVMLERIFYIAKSGEHLALILDNLDIHPIHGPKGYWQKTVDMNPFMKAKNGTLIYPGDKIYLPLELLPTIGRVAQVAETGQVYFRMGERLPAQALPPIPMELPSPPELVHLQPEPVLKIETPPTPPVPAPIAAAPLGPAPAPVPAVPPSGYGDSSTFSISPTFKYLRVEGYDSSTNSKGTLLSNLGSGLDLTWEQVWDRDFETRLTMGATRITINDSATKTIEQKTQDLMHFEFGTHIRMTEKSKFELILGSEEELVYRATSSSVIRVEKIQAPQILLGAGYDFKALKHLSFGGSFYYQYLFPYRTDLYDANAAGGWLGRLRLKHDSKNIQVFGEFNYSTYDRKISPLQIKSTDTGLAIGLGWFWDN